MFKLALHWQILIAMALGAALGLVCNYSSGDSRLDSPVSVPAAKLQPYGFAKPVAIRPGTFWSHDQPNRILMQIANKGPDNTLEVRRVFVGVLPEAAEGKSLAEIDGYLDLPDGATNTVRVGKDVLEPSLGELKKADQEAFALFQRHGRSFTRKVGDRAKMVGDLFLRLLKMVSVPLIICSLITGVMGLGHADRLGKMFGRTLCYYMATSALAIVTGLGMVNLIQPGFDPQRQAATKAEDVPEQGKQLATVLFEQLENLIPANPVSAIANGQFLGIIAFSLAFGVFAILIGGKTAETVRSVSSAGFDIMMRMTMAIIRLAPAGVFCLMMYAAATQGAAVFGRLGFYMFTVACALAIHALVILPLILKFVAKRSPWQFAQAMSPALFTAFSSASSNATLPLTLTSVEQRAKVSNRVSSFVLPLGATVNMDGTALYEVVAVLFIANLTPGVDLSFIDQLIVAFTALLASVGAAGIPHAGLVMMVIILQAVGLPTEAQGLIIAVDRILDMCRTCVNVWSDSCGCAVIARFEATE